MKKPTLRFKAFDSEWDNVPFDKGMSFLSNNTLSRADLNNVAGDVQNVHYGDVLIKFGEVLDLTKEELPFINAGFDFSKLSSSMLMDGDVVIADTAEDETAGKCTEIRNVANNKILAGLHTMPCRPNAKYASGYLGYYMNSPAYHNQLLKYMQGTKVVSISKSALGNTVLAYPSDVTEQKSIGSFFTELDSLIEGKRVKLDKLKKLKLAYLGKMFPKKGSRVPEVRFKGFSGDWVEKRLGDVVAVNSGCDYKHLQSGNIPVYGTGGYMLSVNESLSKVDAVGIGRKGTINKPQLLRAPFWTVDTLFFLTVKDNLNLVFFYALAQCIQWERYDESTGLPSLSKNNIVNIDILLPSPSEQQKIGAFFQNLDNLINLQQQELDKLTNIKSACLSKMFA